MFNQSLVGMPIILDENLKERVLHARSPSRAARRARRGYRQHYAWKPKMDAYRLPDGRLVMHPAAYDVLKKIMASRGATD